MGFLMSEVTQLNFEMLEDRHMLAVWQNAVLQLDVDVSGLVTPLDVLLVIDDLNVHHARNLKDATHSSLPRYFVDTNGDDFASALDALHIISALELRGQPLDMVISIDPVQDKNGNGIVLQDYALLHGQTSVQIRLDVTVTLLNAERKAVRNQFQQFEATSRNNFAFQQKLFPGVNRLYVIATDMLGRQISLEREIVRGDIVADWNAALLNVIRDWTTTSNDPYLGRIVPSAPPMVSRNLAMIHGAMFDAITGVDGKYTPHMAKISAQTGTSLLAAGASAAYEVASALYPLPREVSVWQTTLAESLKLVPEGPSKQAGIAYGKQVAQMWLDARANDGSSELVSIAPSSEAGQWNRTTPDFLPPLLPQWGSVRPLAMDDVSHFHPDPPPTMASEEYAKAVDEVMRLGRVDSQERTNDQTEIALFWADGGGTATPPGHWNEIAIRVSLNENESTVDRSRTMALLNFALADAAIASWYTKYHYDLWRPIDAIRQADQDSNASTKTDASWLPLLRTPPFPSYTSGHSTFSGAAATILSALYGQNYHFSTRSDGHSGLTQKPLASIKERNFDSFWSAAEEAGMSRVYGGIHFEFDNVSGLAIGKAVAAAVLRAG
jgi:membrane-associated phospholipid phosphatase